MRPVKGRSHRGWFPSTFVVRCDKNGNEESGVGGGSDPNKAAATMTVKQPPPLYPLINSHQGSVGALGTPFHVSVLARGCVPRRSLTVHATQAVETLEDAQEVWNTTRVVPQEEAALEVTAPRPDEVDNPCVGACLPTPMPVCVCMCHHSI